MAVPIDAVYRNGVFEPSEQVDVADGERVRLVIVREPPVGAERTAADILAEIAALPLDADDDPDAGRDHDRHLSH